MGREIELARATARSWRVVAQRVPSRMRTLATASSGHELDEAAERRAAALKRYGERQTSAPKAVEVPSPDSASAQEKMDEEVNHAEIWKDYVWYMNRQRDKGWKT